MFQTAARDPIRDEQTAGPGEQTSGRIDAVQVIALGIPVLLLAGFMTEAGACWILQAELHTAAQAAAQEAVLPKATRQSVRAAAIRQLADTSLLIESVEIRVNRTPILGNLRIGPGDRVDVALHVSGSRHLPRNPLGWLGLGFHPTRVVACGTASLP